MKGKERKKQASSLSWNAVLPILSQSPTLGD